MATFGAANNANVSTERTDSGRTYHCFGVLPAGTWKLDSVHIYCGQLFSSPNFSVAVYQGGTSDSEISGATLIFGANDQNAPGSNAWVTVTAGEQVLAGSTRTWVCMASDGATNNYSVAGTDAGDLDLNLRYWETSYVTTAYPSTAPATTGNQAFQSCKMYLTYSAVSGSIVPHAMAGYAQQ